MLTPRASRDSNSPAPAPSTTAFGRGAAALTLREVLEHPCVAGHDVVAGHRGLDRLVRDVAVLDNEDLDQIRMGQFLLSNAYSLLDANLVHLVSALQRRGAVALGIKLSDFWHAPPGPLVRASNSYGFPLVVLPEGPFFQIINPLLAWISERQVAELERSAELHDRLLRAAVDTNGDAHSVLALLDQAIGRRVAVTSHDGVVLWHTGPSGCWPAGEMARVARRRRSGFTAIEGEPAMVVAVPESVSPRTLVIARGVHPEDVLARAALAHAAIVIGMLQIERRQLNEVHRRFSRELLEDLATGRLTDEGMVRTRAAWLGWSLDTPYVVIAARCVTAGAGCRRSTECDACVTTIEAALPQLRAVRRSVDAAVWQLTSAPGPAAVVSLRDGVDGADVVDVLRDAASHARGCAQTAIGVSDVRTDLSNLRPAFLEAVLAAITLMNAPGHAAAQGFRDLGPMRLLAHATDLELMAASAVEVLGHMATDVSESSTELLSTLTALAGHSMRLRATADDAYFHYNTIRHRFARIRKELGAMLDDPTGRLLVSLAVQAVQLLRVRDEFLRVSQPPVME
jgi:purine catabolism regulator